MLDEKMKKAIADAVAEANAETNRKLEELGTRLAGIDHTKIAEAVTKAVTEKVAATVDEKVKAALPAGKTGDKGGEKGDGDPAGGSSEVVALLKKLTGDVEAMKSAEIAKQERSQTESRVKECILGQRPGLAKSDPKAFAKLVARVADGKPADDASIDAAVNEELGFIGTLSGVKAEAIGASPDGEGAKGGGGGKVDPNSAESAEKARATIKAGTVKPL